MNANISEQSGKKPFKNGCIDKDGKKRVSSTFQTIEKRAHFYVNFCHFHRPFKHSNFGLRNADVDYHTHSVCFIALHMVRMLRVCVCVRFFLCFYTFHCILFTFYIENTRANTLFARYQRSERVRKRENIISDAMRWYQYLLSSFSGVFFFHSVETLFNVPTSIYVIVIIWNRIRGKIRNIKWQQ